MENEKTRKFDLEERTYSFAQRIRNTLRCLPSDRILIEDFRQLLRSSGSVGANYIEANQAISTKDFSNRINICRKEAKESHYWLRLIREFGVGAHGPEIDKLIQESLELTKIFSAISQSIKRSLKN